MSTDIDTKELRNYVSTAWFLWGNDAYDRLLDDAGAAAVALGLDFSEVPMNAERPLTAKVGEVMDRIAALEDQAAMGRATQRYLDELGALLKPGEDQDYKERAREVMDRLAALEAELAHERKAGEERAGRALAEIRAIEARNDALKQDNARLRGQISAMLGELEDFAMQNDLPIEDGHGYFGTGLPLSALQEWLFKQKDALAAGGDQ